jgi:hypothetical protein
MVTHVVRVETSVLNRSLDLPAAQSGRNAGEATRVLVAELGEALAGSDLALDGGTGRVVEDRAVGVTALVASPLGERGELGEGVGQAVTDEDGLEGEGEGGGSRLVLVLVVVVNL